MNIALKPEQEQFIQAQIDRGRFKSADEAVSQAFKLLENQERECQSWVEDTRKKVEVAVAELDRGEGVELDLVIDSLSEQLSRHKRRLKDERNCSGTLASDYARGVF